MVDVLSRTHTNQNVHFNYDEPFGFRVLNFDVPTNTGTSFSNTSNIFAYFFPAFI